MIAKNSSIKNKIDFSRCLQVDKETYFDGKLTYLLARDEDIPSMVEEYYIKKGEKLIGITGDDLFDEYLLKTKNSLVSLIETIDWYDKFAKFRRPALCLMKRKDTPLEEIVTIGINKKYEATSRKAIEELGITPNFTVYSGGVEKTVKEGLNDACVEICYTGKSVEENSLEIVKVIRFSDVVMLGVDESSPKCFEMDYKRIQARITNSKTDSYTSLLAKDTNKSMKKCGEEYVEFVRELSLYENATDKIKSRDAIALEFGQLFYTMSLNAARCGVNFEDITRTIYKAIK